MRTRQGVAVPAHSELTITEIFEIPTRHCVERPRSAPCCDGTVPADVWMAIVCILGMHGPMKRLTFSVHVGALMASQGWRFCRCYRHQLTAAHSAVYALLDPVQANFAADDIAEGGR